MCTTILALCLYGFYGSPLLSDHPFIRLEALSHPQLYSENTDLNSLIKAVQENPSRAVSWKNLADYYLEHRHYYESTLYYQEAWRQDLTNIDLKILYTYSLVLLHNGQLTPTIRTLLSELRKVPKLPLILEMLLKNQS